MYLLLIQPFLFSIDDVSYSLIRHLAFVLGVSTSGACMQHQYDVVSFKVVIFIC